MSREQACVGVIGAAALNVPSDRARHHRQPGVCRRAFWPAVGGGVHGAVAVSRRAGNVRRLVRSRGVRTEKRQTSDRHPNGVRPSVHALSIKRPVRQPLSDFGTALRRGWCHRPNPVFWTLATASGLDTLLDISHRRLHHRHAHCQRVKLICFITRPMDARLQKPALSARSCNGFRHTPTRTRLLPQGVLPVHLGP